MARKVDPFFIPKFLRRKSGKRVVEAEQTELNRERSRKKIVADVRQCRKVAEDKIEAHQLKLKKDRDEWNKVFDEHITRKKLEDLKIGGLATKAEKGYVNQLRRNATNPKDAAEVILMDRKLRIVGAIT